jgi:hypothetical protein
MRRVAFASQVPKRRSEVWCVLNANHAAVIRIETKRNIKFIQLLPEATSLWTFIDGRRSIQKILRQMKLINSRKFDEVSVLRILKSFLEGNLIELI